MITETKIQKSKIPLYDYTNNDIIHVPNLPIIIRVEYSICTCTHVACYYASKIIKNCHLCRRIISYTIF